ncbi:glycosyl hydrolase family 76-domain-containing protein [Podospora aff. communis PSN243]|uniref:mannan endo-1,6-alpha-mannosidase n=1 Tax=Podospora aff. communis PSN243 TaxID=3040156 RepID=A0AAV9GYY6_9PEZI|nr:glycosyl hydrolase family 76-domain-containing protein [Podospora aff. communis PSN243]
MTETNACHAVVLAVSLLAASQLTAAYTLDVGSMDSVKTVAASMTEDMMSLYHGNESGGTPGLLPDPYYWWEAGALMGSLVDYWYYTGNTKWNTLTEQGLLFQVGPNNDYMPPNQTRTEGNDDQGFWGMAVMSAAESKFPNPPKDKPQWLALAQAVFNTQAARWDSDECDGGLRWQIFTWNNGYDYKNSISQACFFNIAARLALYTGNQSYANWADKTWNWMTSTELINPDTYYIYDGIHTTNCRNATPYQWTYNAGAFLLGAAAMYNFSTGDEQAKWRERVEHLLNGTMVFFTGPDASIMTEVACEPVNLCDLDQQSFKAYLSRWMAATTKWAPWTYDRIKPLLLASAKAAASTCKGGANGRMCGLKWTDYGKWDGTQGVGQQMAAMEVVLANIIEHAASPVTNRTGGISLGDPGAGGMDVGRNDPFNLVFDANPITVGGRAGAAILTILTILGLLVGCVFVLVEEGKDGETEGSGFCWATVKGRRHREPWNRGRIKGIELFRLGHGSRRISPESDGSALDKDDVVIKTHEEFSLKDDEIESNRRPLPARIRRNRTESTQSDTTSSYWSAGYHDSVLANKGKRRRLDQRRSYPGPARISAEVLERRGVRNNTRAARWREPKQYV